MSKIVGNYDGSIPGTGDSCSNRYCPINYFSSNIATLSAIPAFTNYLTVSKAELRTVFTNTSADLSSNNVNICNATRVVDIVTIYMAALLGSPVKVDNIVNNFVYDATTTYKYPFQSNSPFSIFPPQKLPVFLGLEQAYWTIVVQYTTSNENNLRNDKDNYWCSDQERKLDYLIKRIDRVQYISDLIPNPQKKWTNIEIIYIFYLNKKKNTKISVQ